MDYDYTDTYDADPVSTARRRAEAVLRRCDETLRQERDPAVIEAAARVERLTREHQEEADREAAAILDRRAAEQARMVQRSARTMDPATQRGWDAWCDARIALALNKLPANVRTKQGFDDLIEGIAGALGRGVREAEEDVKRELRAEFKQEIEQARNANGALLARVAHLEAILAGRAVEPTRGQEARHAPLQ